MGVPLRAGVFDTLRTVEPAQQVAVAEARFGEVMVMDSASAMAALDELLQYARSSSHKKLEVLALGFKGHYFFHVLSGRQREPGIAFFKEALAEAERYGEDTLEAELTNRVGRILFLNEDHREGFEYLLRSDYKLKELGYEHFQQINQYLTHIAWAYYYYQSFERAEKYLELALRYTQPDSKQAYRTYLNLGSTYGNLGLTDKALESFQQAYDLAIQNGDSSAIGTGAVALGGMWLNKGSLELAQPYLEQAVRLCQKYPDYQEGNSTLDAFLNMAEYYLAFDDMQAADEYLQRACAYIQERQVTFHVFWELYYRLSARYYKGIGNFELATAYQDSLLAIKDTLVAYNDANLLTGVETLLATESHINELAVLEKERSRQRAIRNASWFIGGLTLLLLVGIIYSLRMRNIRRKRVFQLEREKAEKQIENYQHQLHNFLEKIRQKNQLIEALKLEPVHQTNGYSNGHGHGYPNGIPVAPNTELIARLHESVILTDADWVEFRRLFEQAYPGFLQSLKVKYADLTQAERRFLALVKLDLTVQEMANMLGISPDSVSKTRQRIRRKLQLESYKEIPGVVAAL